MVNYVDYLEYIRFASIHPQLLQSFLSRKFNLSHDQSMKVIQGMRVLGLIYGDGDLVTLTDKGRKMVEEAEIHRNGKVVG